MTQEAQPPVKRGVEWKSALMEALAAPGAPRTFSAGEFAEFVGRSVRPGISASGARDVAEVCVSAGVLGRVGTGMLFNRRAMPTPATALELVDRIRSGAVVSLWNALNQVHNNPTPIVTAVVPIVGDKRPNGGPVEPTPGPKFHFYALSERFFPRDDVDRRLLMVDTSPYPVFRPEAALLQWIHLAGTQRSTLPVPPHGAFEELDAGEGPFGALNVETLRSIAKRYQMGPALETWLGEWAQMHDVALPPAPTAHAEDAPVSRRRSRP